MGRCGDLLLVTFMFLLFSINHNLTGMMVSKGNHPQVALFQSDTLQFCPDRNAKLRASPKKELVAFNGLMVVLMLQMNYHDSNINVI